MDDILISNFVYNWLSKGLIHLFASTECKKHVTKNEVSN